jgi:hypothetical protein
MKFEWTRWVTGAVALALMASGAALAQAGPGTQSQDAMAAATALVRPSVVAVETRFDEPRLDDA